MLALGVYLLCCVIVWVLYRFHMCSGEEMQNLFLMDSIYIMLSTYRSVGSISKLLALKYKMQTSQRTNMLCLPSTLQWGWWKEQAFFWRYWHFWNLLEVFKMNWSSFTETNQSTLKSLKSNYNKIFSIERNWFVQQLVVVAASSYIFWYCNLSTDKQKIIICVI